MIIISKVKKEYSIILKTCIFLYCLSVLFFQSGISQVNPTSGSATQGPPPAPIFIEDISGRPYGVKTPDDIEGSAFLLPEWNRGAVKFRNGRYTKDLSLLFNVYNNQLYFRKGDVQLEFVLPVYEFMIWFRKGDDTMAVVYRSGYPSTEKTSPETFFELLVDGKIQLLNYRHKKIKTYQPYNQPERRQFTDGEQLYAFADGRVIKLKKDKKDILDALPQYAEAIGTIAEPKKLKLKSEEEIVKLFKALNANRQ